MVDLEINIDVHPIKLQIFLCENYFWARQNTENFFLCADTLNFDGITKSNWTIVLSLLLFNTNPLVDQFGERYITDRVSLFLYYKDPILNLKNNNTYLTI